MVINDCARAFVETSYKSIAILGQNPITNVGTRRLKPIESSLASISLTIDKAGILGPKKTLLHIERRYIGVKTRPIAASKMVMALNNEVKPSWLVIPRKTVISLINPLIPGKAREARELVKKKAKVIGKAFARPPMLGIERVFVLS